MRNHSVARHIAAAATVVGCLGTTVLGTTVLGTTVLGTTVLGTTALAASSAGAPLAASGLAAGSSYAVLAGHDGTPRPGGSGPDNTPWG
jgi:hypothetical protein